ncbi:MAG: PEP-utilizing enzyme [Candidatus Micrarchaeota archaeon]|nr:PEP-utilizing enzyme [Candidatus Micrarchaeota archaeon]
METTEFISRFTLDKREWVEKGLAGTPYFSYVYMDCCTRVAKITGGEAHSITMTFFSNDFTRFHYDRASMINLRNSLINKVNDNLSYLKNLENSWLVLLKDLDKTHHKIDITDISKLSKQELFDLYNEFYEKYVAEYDVSLIYQDSFSMDAQNFISPVMEKILPKDKFHEYYAILFSPINESFINSEKKDLMKIANKSLILKLTTEEGILNSLKNDLESHSKKYFWIQNNYAHTIILDSRYFASRIIEELKEGVVPDSEINKINSIVPETIKMKNELIRQLNLSQDVINLIKIAECFAFMQDERKKYVLKGCHYLQRFLVEFSRRSGLTEKELRYCIHPEIKGILFDGIYDRRELERRREYCVIINVPGNYEVVSGKDAQETYHNIFSLNVSVDELDGVCASRGFVEGPVRIIMKKEDLKYMQKGEILVTSMTRPEMVVAMKKAIGIITDEGGITSHAAILSREMGIPCVLATKIATKVLKNGDLVELNADEGLVRILRN